MKICNPLRGAACVLALSACAATSALAGEKDKGFYLGVDLGKSTYDVNKSDLVLFPVVRDSTLQTADWGYSLNFGYRFMPFIALEASLKDFGDLEKSETGFLSAAQTFGGILGAELGTRGGALSVIGTLPISKMEFFAKVGALRAETKLRTRLNVTFIGTGTPPPVAIGSLPVGSSGGVAITTVKSTAVLYGVGFGYNVGESLFLKLEYTAVPKVAEESDAIGFDADLSAFSLGFQYRF